ncbi:response regulator [Natronococcus pandeyae]|uniref:response regulator n=1 Tax=Natronococcus pandeyae TaxID=2055836 RepID=UPI0027B8A73D|nr:response regulator [Natronococcus pandeyae]
MADQRFVEGLLIDPNPEDVRLFFEALENEKVSNHIHAVPDGAEALDFLHQRGEYTDAARPDLILLDIELPEMDGYELLETLNCDSELAGISVLILTGSDDAEAVVQLYDLMRTRSSRSLLIRLNFSKLFARPRSSGSISFGGQTKAKAKMTSPSHTTDAVSGVSQ